MVDLLEKLMPRRHEELPIDQQPYDCRGDESFKVLFLVSNKTVAIATFCLCQALTSPLFSF